MRAHTTIASAFYCVVYNGDFGTRNVPCCTVAPEEFALLIAMQPHSRFVSKAFHAVVVYH
jgi:hypothetical protein